MKQFVNYLSVFLLGIVVGLGFILWLQTFGVPTQPATELYWRKVGSSGSEFFRNGDTVLVGRDTFYVNHYFEPANNNPHSKHTIK